MPDTMTPDMELKALQTWIKQVAGLNSWRHNENSSKLPRSVVIFDTATRGTITNLSRYEYTVPVRQYGRMSVPSVDEAVKYQGKLQIDLGEKCNVLPVIEGENIIRKLRNVQLDFYGNDLEGQFSINYEVTYTRDKPPEAPHATEVVSAITTKF